MGFFHEHDFNRLDRRSSSDGRSDPNFTESNRRLDVVGIGATAYDVVEVCKRTQPQVAIVEVIMPGDVYLAIANAIKISPLTKIVAFTGATGIDSP